MTSSTTTLFTDKAEAYAKYRPGYPAETIKTIMNFYPDGTPVRAADIGAGTGISSRLLAEAGAEVTAVEPNASMIGSADAHPGVTYREGSAEQTGLESGSMDLITSFQSFHWFRFGPCLKEFNRVLKDSGQLAVVWSYWDEGDPFTAEYLKLIQEATNKNPDHVSPYDGLSGQIKKWRIKFLWKFRVLPYFKDVQRHRFKYVERVDLDRLIGCAYSQSYLLHEGPEWEALCGRIEDLCKQYEAPSLVYNVNLFTARPS